MNLEKFVLKAVCRTFCKSYILYETLSEVQAFRIRIDKIDGFIRTYDGIRYLVLLGPEKYNVIYNIIKYLMSLKSTITQIFFHYFAKIKVHSYDSLSLEERLILHNVKIIIKSVLNKDKNHYYYNIFLEKCSYQLAKK